MIHQKLKDYWIYVWSLKALLIPLHSPSPSLNRIIHSGWTVNVVHFYCCWRQHDHCYYCFLLQNLGVWYQGFLLVMGPEDLVHGQQVAAHMGDMNTQFFSHSLNCFLALYRIKFVVITVIFRLSLCHWNSKTKIQYFFFNLSIDWFL